jgi:hypothetical protein
MFGNTGAAIPIIPQNTKITAKDNDHLLRPKEEKEYGPDKGKGNNGEDGHPSGENAVNASGILLNHLVVSSR